MGNEEKPTSKEEYEKILDTLNHFESGCQGFYDTTYVPFKELTESQLKSICDIVPSLADLKTTIYQLSIKRVIQTI